jgi:hypothetical protein
MLPAATTNVSFVSGAPVSVLKPLNESEPRLPDPAPLSAQVVSLGGPTSVAFAPVALIDATFENESVAGPLTDPPVVVSAQFASAPFTSTELPAPPPSNEIGVVIVPPLASTTSSVPGVPVIAISLTSLAARVSLPLEVVTVISPPDWLTVTVPPEAETVHGVGVGVGDGVGEGDGLGSGDGDSLGSGDGDGDSLGVGVGDGDSLGSGEGDGDSEGLGDGDSLGSGDGDGDSEGVGDGDGDSDGEGLGSGEVDGEGDGDSDGDGDGGSDGDGSGGALGDGDGDSDGEGSGDGGSDGDGSGDGGSSLFTAVSVRMIARPFGAGPFDPLGYGDGAGDSDGAIVGAALGLGDGLTGTQNVPSLVQYPTRPFRSTPGMSSDFGGDVRAGAGVAVDAGAGVVDGVTIGTMIGVVTGATQSSGCTTAYPVVVSNEMTRTPDCAAHCASSSASAVVSVTA